MFFSKAVFFGNSSQAERLTGKAAAEDVKGGNIGDGYCVDVTGRFFAEVGGVGLAGEFVPVAGEDTLRSSALESTAEATDAAEKINETKWCRRDGRDAIARF